MLSKAANFDTYEKLNHFWVWKGAIYLLLCIDHLSETEILPLNENIEFCHILSMHVPYGVLGFWGFGVLGKI